MLLGINHRTEYAYDRRALYSVQYVRLTPRCDQIQTVLDWSLETGGQSTVWRDGFGNIVHTVVHNDPHQYICLHACGQVETQETHGVIPWAEGDISPELYLRQTPLTQIDDSIRDFVRRFSTHRAKRNDLAGLHALMGGIHDRIAYVPGETDPRTSASDVLALGRGVCQDHAHLFIACCRAWGIPARYVSGYLHTDSQEDGRHLATHAWAEALVEHLGWVSFDPSNRQSATQAYVRLAVALDYLGAAPVRGLRQGGGQEDMNVRVQIQQASNQ